VLRPKILTAGAGLLLISTLSALLGLRMFGLAGLGGIGSPVEALPKEESGTAIAVRAIALPTTCVAAALGFGPWIFQDSPWQPWLQPWPYAVVVVAGSSAQLLERLGKIPASYRIVLMFLIEAAALWAGYKVIEWSNFQLGLWMAAVAAATALGAAWARGIQGLARIVAVESLILLLGGGLLIFYSLNLFGRIPPWLGGGGPAQVELSLRSDVPPLKGRWVRARLLEETSNGYYIEQGRGALFIPRDVVQSAALNSWGQPAAAPALASPRVGPIPKAHSSN